MNIIYGSIALTIAFLLYIMIFNLYMSCRAHLLQEVYARYVFGNDRRVLRKVRSIRRVLEIAGVSYIYLHHKRLTNGNNKTIPIDLLLTIDKDTNASHGVFTNELLFGLLRQAKKEYQKRAFSIFTSRFYRDMLGV